MDVVTLWIWNSENIGRMREYVDQCRQLFPDKPIVMGVYLRDYPKVAPVPVDRVRRQMEGIADLFGKGKLAGYSILAAVLIDGHRPQADAVRDFIARSSGRDFESNPCISSRADLQSAAVRRTATTSDWPDEVTLLSI